MLGHQENCVDLWTFSVIFQTICVLLL